jgi:tetratricopeptide (TPR) repeat protein
MTSKGSPDGQVTPMAPSAATEEKSSPEDTNGLILCARRAAQRGHWIEAWRCWETVRARDPDYAPAYFGAGNALREAARYDEAELVLGEGAERFPDNEQIAIARAWLASARSDWSTALSRWGVVRARSPQHGPAYVGIGNALRELGRYDKAELVLGEGAERFPDDEQIAIARVLLANARGDLPATLCRWEAVRTRSTHRPLAYVTVGTALRDAGRLEEAELVLGEGTERLPDNEYIAVAHAWLANARRDWPAALSRWEAVRARFPHHAPAYVGIGNALREVGRYDDAETVLGEGSERFPDDEQIAIARGWLANARRDWLTALGRWEAAQVRFPKNPWCYLGNSYALRGARRFDAAETMLVTAETVLKAAREQGLNAATARRLESEIAKAHVLRKNQKL